MVRSSILTMTDEESAPSEDAVDRASATMSMWQLSL